MISGLEELHQFPLQFAVMPMANYEDVLLGARIDTGVIHAGGDVT